MAAAHCSRCDARCCTLTVVLGPSESIPAELTAELPSGARVMAKGADGWCVALNRERMNCGMYETRPQACRRFPMAGPYCNAIFPGNIVAAQPKVP